MDSTHAKLRDFTYTAPWNVFLITIGSFAFSFGVKAVAIPQGFISVGISGAALILYYVVDFSPGQGGQALNFDICSRPHFYFSSSGGF